MSDLSAESPTDLQSKLEEYQRTLQSVEVALLEDPNEEQLLRLKNDLLEVIGLTRDLYDFKVNQAHVGDYDSEANKIISEINRTVEEEDLPPMSTGTYISGILSTVIEELIKTRDLENDIPDNSTTSPANDMFEYINEHLDGRIARIIVKNEKTFCSIVKIYDGSEIFKDEVPSSYGVKLHVFRSNSKLDYRAGKVLVLPMLDNLESGTKCRYINPCDGLVYKCKIHTLNGDTYDVILDDSRDTNVTARYDQILPPKPTTQPPHIRTARGGADKNKGKKKLKEITTPGGYKIPENLQIKPTDSQHEIQTKRRKIHMLKKEQRKEHVEDLAKKRQTTWLSHAKKTTYTGASKKYMIARPSSDARPVQDTVAEKALRKAVTITQPQPRQF